MIKNEGYCFCCDSLTIFESKNDWFRDFYLCRKSGSLPGECALIYCPEKFFPDWRSLTIHETSLALGGASLSIKRVLALHTFIIRMVAFPCILRCGRGH